MYSIVMLAAMTAAPETPDFFFKNKGGGCQGCYGGGCNGYTAGGGCYGSGWGCGGCRGGGYGFGGGCNGCFGGGHGLFGGHGFLGHKSGGGCCGGYAAPYYTGCGGYAAPAVAPTVVGYAAVPGLSTVPATGIPEAVATLPANRAQVVVRVPADAKLFADGQATQLTGPERVFLTPDLSASRDFQYTLKVEYMAGSETKSDSKQIVVRGGHRTVVEFAVPAVEKATSAVTVTLPQNAKLFVDGVAAATTGGKHTFSTPELPKGKPFVYEFRAEIDKDGQTESLSQKITFNAGEPVVVDFSETSATRTALK